MTFQIEPGFLVSLLSKVFICQTNFHKYFYFILLKQKSKVENHFSGSISPGVGNFNQQIKISFSPRMD